MPQPNRYPAMHVQAPNVLGAARAGMGLAQGFQNLQTGALRNRMAEAEMGRQSELQDIRKRLFGGAGDPAGASGMPADPSAGGAAGGMDQGLFLKYAAMDPQGAKQMWDMIGEMDEASREKAREKTETFGPMALGVLQAEPIQQPGLYRTLLDEAKRMGIQGMPETWSQDAMAWLGLQTTKAMSMGEAIDYYEEEEAVKGQSPLGKLAADRKSGLLDEETYAAGRAEALEGSKSSYQFGNILAGDDEISPARKDSQTGEIEVLKGGKWTPAEGGQFVSEASPYKVMPNALGRSTLVDTNTMEQVWPTPGAQPQTQGLPTQGIPEGADFSAGTGASGFFGGMANTITDALGWGLQAPDTEEAARTLDRLMTVTNLHMTAEMPGRPSNYIRERLAELEVKPGQLSQGDERSRIKMEQIRELMVMEYNRAQQVAGNPDAYSKEQVQMSSDNGGKIKELIDQYDQILGNWGGLQPGSETTIDGVPVKRIK